MSLADPALPAQCQQVLDGLRSAQTGGLDASQVGAHLAGPPVGIQLLQVSQEKIGKRNDGPERVVEVVSNAARKNTERFQTLAGCHAFQLIPLVQARSFLQLLVNLDAPQRHTELITQNLVALNFGQTLEHGNPQALGFEDQREYHQSAAARFRMAAWWKELSRRKRKRQRGLGPAIQHAEDGQQLFRAAIGESRQVCGSNTGAGEGFEQQPLK